MINPALRHVLSQAMLYTTSPWAQSQLENAQLSKSLQCDILKSSTKEGFWVTDLVLESTLKNISPGAMTAGDEGRKILGAGALIVAVVREEYM